MLNGFVTAVRTLTILPVPGKDSERLASALPWFPLVGGLLGAALYGLARAAGLLPDGVSAAAVGAVALLVAGTVLTRGLHLDGLADFADGFGGSRDRERVLAIMKDSSVGAFGAVALTVVLVAKFAAFHSILGLKLWEWVPVALIVSRTVQVELAAALPYARPEGGTAGSFVQGSRGWHRFVAAVVGLALCVGAAGPAGAAALPAGWIVARLLGVWYKRRVGGITGDLLGATSEMVETALLLAAAGAGSPLLACTGWSWLWVQA
jgi:adenosylcobinamide-GDP ribazoletransferase